MKVEETVSKLNNFRKNPHTFEKEFMNYGKALRRVKKNVVAGEIETWGKNLIKLKDLPELIFSESLSKACEEEILDFIDNKNNISIFHKKHDDLIEIAGKYCENFTKLTCILDEGSIEDLICRIFISSFDKERNNRSSLICKDFYYVGVAARDYNNETLRVIILADLIEEKKEKYNIKGIECLYDVFNEFDINKTGLVDPKILKEALSEAGLDKSNPALYKLICEMDTPENRDKGLDVHSFISFLDNKLSENSKEGIERAFNLFIGDPNKQIIDEACIRKICSKMGIILDKDEAKEIIERASISGKGLTLEEFINIMSQETNSPIK